MHSKRLLCHFLWRHLSVIFLRSPLVLLDWLHHGMFLIDFFVEHLCYISLPFHLCLLYYLVIGCRSFVKSNTSLLFPQLLSCISEKNLIYMCHQSIWFPLKVASFDICFKLHLFLMCIVCFFMYLVLPWTMYFSSVRKFKKWIFLGNLTSSGLWIGTLI